MKRLIQVFQIHTLKQVIVITDNEYKQGLIRYVEILNNSNIKKNISWRNTNA